MFFEYALDPAVMQDWLRARYFMDGFGPSQGRFLADYPQGWCKAASSAFKGGDAAAKRLEECLTVLKKRRCFSARFGALYKSDLAWLTNALAEHSRRPFRAIIAMGASTSDVVLDADAVSNETERWRVPTGRLVRRTSEAVAGALDLLLRLSKNVAIVDPYFRPDERRKRDFIAMLLAPISGATIVSVHSGLGMREQDPTYQHVADGAVRHFPDCIPRGMGATLHVWRSKDRGADGARLHNRYLITDLGGVQFGDSLEAGNGDEEDRLSLLSEEDRLHLWDQYCGSKPAFPEAGPPIRINGTGRGARPAGGGRRR